jgi:hypothetical protein
MAILSFGCVLIAACRERALEFPRIFQALSRYGVRHGFPGKPGAAASASFERFTPAGGRLYRDFASGVVGVARRCLQGCSCGG